MKAQVSKPHNGVSVGHDRRAARAEVLRPGPASAGRTATMTAMNERAALPDWPPAPVDMALRNIVTNCEACWGEVHVEHIKQIGAAPADGGAYMPLEAPLNADDGDYDEVLGEVTVTVLCGRCGGIDERYGCALTD